MSDERCEVCDRPDGYENNPHPDGSDGCEYPCCTSLCWGGRQCEGARVDWRARFHSLDWRAVEWTTRKGKRWVNAFCAVTPSDGFVSVLVLETPSGRRVDLGKFCAAERGALYEALRKAEP